MSNLLDVIKNAVISEQDIFSAHGWTLTRVFGGMNGMTFRAENADLSGTPYAIKVRKRDGRNRAQREFSALQLLNQLGKSIAPKPISLHIGENDISGDIVVTDWIEGITLDEQAVQLASTWDGLLETFALLHTVKPSQTSEIIDAVMSVRSTDDLITEIMRRHRQLPDGQLGDMTKSEMGNFITNRVAKVPTFACPNDQISLITCDSGPLNVIDSDGQMIIIDWEYTGWGDPAMDIADFIVRPECKDIPLEVKQNAIEAYAEKMQLPAIADRIRAYEYLMLVFWLVITSRGFAQQNTQSFKGVRTFTAEQTRQQQRDYIRRIESVG